MGEFQNIDSLIQNLDQKDRIERKVQFILDIRGYLIVNKLKGDYAEFGLYRGEMLYCAHKVMNEKFPFTRYIGLDTFEGEPEPQANDEKMYAFVGKGGFKSEFEKVEQNLKTETGLTPILICGDFRIHEISDQFIKLNPELSLAVIDCNWLSSQEAALDLCLPFMKEGGIIYHDDLYVGNSGGTGVLDLFSSKLEEYHLRCEPFKTYPPFAKAFFVFKK